MGKKIGIDLGTTYSCVSYVDETGIVRQVEPSEGGGYSTPSVVFFEPETNEVVVGKEAREAGATNPQNVVERVKNYMGDPGYTLSINDKEYSPTAISALILQKLIKDAETWFGGEEIDGAVITCPAYFGDAAREATRKAGENVTLSNGNKLNVMQIVDEPVAAALAYGDTLHEDLQKTVLIYDLGGGTFDVTVMKLDFVGDNKHMEVITTNGNHQLGGKDWDFKLAELVRNRFCDLTESDPNDMMNDPEMILWFSEKIEGAKQALTNKTSTFLTPNFNGRKERIDITREEFEVATEELLNSTIQLIDDMMRAKGLDMMSDIDAIILVGGSTRMPQVEARLNQEYGKPMIKFDPERAVSIGAALVANGLKVPETKINPVSGEEETVVEEGPLQLTGEDGSNIVVVTKCTKSYGLLASKGGVDIIGNVIMMDTEKPANITRRFGTSSENQLNLNLRVYENESRETNEAVENSKELYENCIVELTPGLPARAPIDITFHLDASGILSITALDVLNNVSKTVQPQRVGAEVTSVGLDDVNDVVIK